MAHTTVPSAGFGLALQPAPGPTGLYPQYISHNTETVSITGMKKEYTITSSTGMPVLHSTKKRSLLTDNENIILSDMSNHVLITCTCKDSLSSGKAKIEANLENGNRVLEIGKAKASQLDMVFQDIAGPMHTEQRFYIGAADWSASDTFIRDRRNDSVVAYIRQPLAEKSRTVTIAPGIDMSLIIAICISLDTKFKRDEMNAVATDVVMNIIGL